MAGFVSAFSGVISTRLNLIFSRQTPISSGFLLIAIGSLIISTATELIILISGLAVFGIWMSGNPSGSGFSLKPSNLHR